MTKRYNLSPTLLIHLPKQAELATTHYHTVHTKDKSCFPHIRSSNNLFDILVM